MNTLDIALEYAARGWAVFPCLPKQKIPATDHGFLDATTDIDQIASWWTNNPDYNIGIATGKVSGIVALDFDVKKDQPGKATFREMQLAYGSLDTLCSNTPSGGWHLLFEHPGGEIRNRTGVLPGLDVRGDGGYIVAPGSCTSDGPYTWNNNKPVKSLNTGIHRLIQASIPPKSNGEAKPSLDIDAMLAGISEGQRDDALYKYACSLRGRGVILPEAITLAQLAASRCKPPFNASIAVDKVRRAYEQYQTNEVAEAKTEVIAWEAPQPINSSEWEKSRISPDCIVEDYLFADVGVLIAPGGTGKTTVVLFEAIHIVLGIPLYGLKIYRHGVVVILTAEDSREMLVARLREICAAMPLAHLQIELVMKRVLISDVCGDGRRLTEVINDGVYPSRFVDVLADGLVNLAPSMIVIDPAVSFGVGESRVNDAEQGLIEAARRLIRRLNCCVRYIHHTGKGNARDKTVDQYSGRGGSAFADGARMVHVLQPQTNDEWHKLAGTDLPPDWSGMVLARPKITHCPPVPSILLRRRGYQFEHASLAESDPMSGLRRDGDKLLTAMMKLDRPTQNTLESLDGGLGRNRTRTVIRYLLDIGAVEYRQNPKSGGAQQYLYITGTPVNGKEGGTPACFHELGSLSEES